MSVCVARHLIDGTLALNFELISCMSMRIVVFDQMGFSAVGKSSMVIGWITNWTVSMS